MSKRKTVAHNPNIPEGHQTYDSFQNFAAKVGIGTGNQNDASTYGFNPISRIRLKLEWAYRGSWVVGNAVDCVAEDMTREGVTVQSKDDPDKLKQLDREVLRLRLWSTMCSTIKWSRLYGGALGFLMINGQNPSTPLRLETIQQGQFCGILPLDRWMVNPSYQDLVEDYGPDFGKPKFYNTTPDVTTGMKPMKIHYSRLIRLEGVELPYWQKTTENLWGLSILERIWDRLVMFDSATTGAAQLIYKAHLRTIQVEGLRDIISMGGPAMTALARNIEIIRQLQSNEGITLLDTKDVFETHQYSFAGLDDLLTQFGAQLCGALNIPRTRLFGDSPGGLGSDGKGEQRQYESDIRRQQVTQIGDGMHKAYVLTYISKFGAQPPEDFAIDFNPISELTDEQNAKVVVDLTTAINTAFESQLIDRATGMKELKAISDKTGVFTNIQDEDITAAESDPDPTPEALGLELPPKPEPGLGAGAKPATAKPGGK